LRLRSITMLQRCVFCPAKRKHRTNDEKTLRCCQSGHTLADLFEARRRILYCGLFLRPFHLFPALNLGSSTPTANAKVATELADGCAGIIDRLGHNQCLVRLICDNRASQSPFWAFRQASSLSY
jgi:ferredoxin-thioredoxin reductase catalytic subunit